MAAGTPAGLFVTGTGTEVGKSVVAAVIANEAAARGQRVRVFKPAVSGLSGGEESDHALLRRAARCDQSDDEIAPYRFDPPVSPHLAAELAGVEIDAASLPSRARRAADGGDLLVCEGVGGLLVPLTMGYLVRDLARDLGMPVVIVADPALGTINHTLLTIEATRAVGLEARAVVLSRWPAEPGDLERSNLRTIERLGAIEVLTLPQIDLAEPATWPSLGLA